MAASPCGVAAASSAERTLELYRGLLDCAHRMLITAKARRWTTLLEQEAEFFRTFEMISNNETQHGYTEEMSDQRGYLLVKTFANVEKTRGLLNQRKRELARQQHCLDAPAGVGAYGDDHEGCTLAPC